MNEPKHHAGDAVVAELDRVNGYKPARIVGTKVVYLIVFDGYAATHERTEDKIRERIGPEEAWEKATMLIGIRSNEKGKYCCLDGQEKSDFDKETRHQVYQLLGSASIRITEEVKTDVRRLIGIADGM